MYLGGFSSREDVCKEFAIDSFEGTVLFAAYEIDGYDGYAAVIFVNEGKFYYVVGGHCSCYGLEGQWAPDEMPLDALIHIVREGGDPCRRYRDQIETVLRVVDDLSLDKAPALHVEIAVHLVFGG